MKIIRTAAWNDLPGDPRLPPGVTNNMIEEQFGTGESDTETGNFSLQSPLEVTINGEEFNKWAGEQIFPLTDIWLKVVCSYEYDQLNDTVNVNVQQVVDENNRDVTAYDVGSFAEDAIKEGIKNVFRNR